MAPEEEAAAVLGLLGAAEEVVAEGEAPEVLYIWFITQRRAPARMMFRAVSAALAARAVPGQTGALLVGQEAPAGPATAEQ